MGGIYESPSVIPTTTVKYTPGDYFFFFTDGIIDQFGGVKERKLLRSGLSRLLLSSLSAEGNNRSLNLELGIRKWQGALPQTDDMLLLGFGTEDINHLTS